MKPNKEIFFSPNLKSLLKERHNTLTQLSKVTGLSKSSLHNYINGVQPRGLIAIIKLCDFFNISFDQLVFSEKPKLELHQPGLASFNDGKYEVYIKKI